MVSRVALQIHQRVCPGGNSLGNTINQLLHGIFLQYGQTVSSSKKHKMTQPTQDGSTSGSETEKIPQKIVKIGSKSSSDDSSKTNMPHSPAYANGKKAQKNNKFIRLYRPSINS